MNLLFDRRLFFTLWVAELPISIIIALLFGDSRGNRESDKKFVEEIAKAVARETVRALEEERRKEPRS